MTEKRYRIISMPADHCLGPRDERGSPRLKATLVGDLTEEEFQQEFGPGIRITEMMCLETNDIDGYTIHITLTDVLACENEHSHQDVLVNMLRKSEGMEPLEHEELVQRARRYGDLTPEAAQFLLGCAEGGMHPDELDDEMIMNEALSSGLTLGDFLRPQGEEGPLPSRAE